MRTMIRVAIVLLLALTIAPATAEGFWESLAPDAALLARPLDGGITGDTYEGISWEVWTDPWEPVLGGRDLWVDVITPTENTGYGASLDIVPDGAAALGAGWRDDAWFGYLGAHILIAW